MAAGVCVVVHDGRFYSCPLSDRHCAGVGEDYHREKALVKVVRRNQVFHNWSQLRRLGAFVLVAALLSFLSFAILFLEYGILNFGDTDLPPFQPNTPLERAFDALWFTVTFGAGLLWLCVIVYAIALLARALKRHVV